MILLVKTWENKSYNYEFILISRNFDLNSFLRCVSLVDLLNKDNFFFAFGPGSTSIILYLYDWF